MADETTEATASPDPDDDAVDVGDIEDADGEPGTDSEDEPAPEDEPARVERAAARYSVADMNRGVVGELIVHFATREARFVVDGEAALRILALYSRGDLSLIDHAHPDESNARNMWLALDLDRVLAISWIPGLRDGRVRATIDPLPAAT
ncbi:MAG TPA: hypothetical protein VF183_04815 [Acidimicrobiales bacterium]